MLMYIPGQGLMTQRLLGDTQSGFSESTGTTPRTQVRDIPMTVHVVVSMTFDARVFLALQMHCP